MARPFSAVIAPLSPRLLMLCASSHASAIDVRFFRTTMTRMDKLAEAESWFVPGYRYAGAASVSRARGHAAAVRCGKGGRTCS
jgi:hypothetical protein